MKTPKLRTLIYINGSDLPDRLFERINDWYERDHIEMKVVMEEAEKERIELQEDIEGWPGPGEYAERNHKFAKKELVKLQAFTAWVKDRIHTKTGVIVDLTK